MSIVERALRAVPPTEDMIQVCRDWHDEPGMMYRIGVSTLSRDGRLYWFDDRRSPPYQTPTIVSVNQLSVLEEEAEFTESKIARSTLGVAARDLVRIRELLKWCARARAICESCAAVDTSVRRALASGLPSKEIRAIVSETIEAALLPTD